MISLEANELLDEIMLERISTMSDRELHADLAKYNSNIEAMNSEFLSIITAQSHLRKKQTLKLARKKMEEQNLNHREFDIREYLERSGKDAKGMLIELLAQGKLPENLTLAFRDGEDFTDDDAEKVLQDLVSMGAVNLVDKKD